jgi:tetraacyldisaccharide 4'-kinase
MMKKILTKWINIIWYEDFFIAVWLMPFSFIYMDVMRFRRWLYKTGRKAVTKVSVPVIMVGNLTVGGTGKTPLVIYLTKELQAQGFNPGVISRGYGGESEIWPQRVRSNSHVSVVGEEAILIAEQTQCPVAIGPIRADAAKLLIEDASCDVILSDDGLQHYALARDIEVMVIDGERRFGNNYCLPAGPLREPQDRKLEVDFIVCNGGEIEEGEIFMQLEGDIAVNLQNGEQKSLDEFNQLNCHALAGIGNPQRFFKHLEKYHIKSSFDEFPDHHIFTETDIAHKKAEAIFMTEKDAVKCKLFATDKHWVVPVQAKLPTDFIGQLISLLKSK